MQEVIRQFERNFEEGLECGASLSVWKDGQEILTLSGGQSTPEGGAWTDDTLIPIYSATKVPAASALLLALYDCCLSPELEVGTIWPAFPAPQCTIAEVLSHQAGLAALDIPAPYSDLEACRAAIERTHPAWAPPRHGYHPHTFGPLLDILMLELTGQKVTAFWEQRIRRPLELDLYIGLPESEFPRVAMLRPPRFKGKMPSDSFYRQFFDTHTSIYRAFHSITGLASPREMNTPAAWQSGSPAKGGVASARGLAQFYQALMGKTENSPFPEDVLDWLRLPRCSGMDLTLLEPTSFTCGAMCEPSRLFGRKGFGHAGAGGSHAFCEPSTGYSFAYVMNQMEFGILPGERVQRLIQAFTSSTSDAV